MTFRMTLRLLLAVCVLGVVIWLIEDRVQSTETRRREAGRVFPQARADAVTHVTVSRGDLVFECVRKRDGWRIEKPIPTPAAPGAVARLLAALEAMNRDEIITEPQRLERELGLGDYGLEKPAARVLFRDAQGSHEVSIGSPAPLGSMVYVQVTGQLDVLATSGELLEAIPTSLEGFWDHVLVHGEAAATVRVEIQRRGGSFIRLVKSEDRWNIQQPVVAMADADRLGRMLQALFALQARQFVWDPVTNAPSAAPSGLQPAESSMVPYDLSSDDPALKVTVWVTGDEVGKGVLFGKDDPDNAGAVYARRADSESVCLVERAILDVLNVTPDDLRNRQVVPVNIDMVRRVTVQDPERRLVLEREPEAGWTVTEPIRARADDAVVTDLLRRLTALRAESFVDGSATNLADHGLEPPAYTIELSAGGADGPSFEVRVGRIDKSAPVGYLKHDISRSLCGVAGDDLRGLGERLADPITYRDRLILSLEPMDICRITLARDGWEQTVAMGGDGIWKAEKGVTNEVDLMSVDGVLFGFSNLRALRIEEAGGTLASYGLEPPTASLTVGLTSGGIQKSLRLGYLARTDGIYATVQGSGLVFVLERKVADSLIRSLLVTPETSKAKAGR